MQCRSTILSPGYSFSVALSILPNAQLDDADVTAALSRAVAVINPALDVLAEFDPLGLRERTHHLGDSDNAGDKALDAVAALLNVADVPGTRSWDSMDRAARIKWWVHRIGALNTVLVAFPGAFGVLAARLPIQDLFGFSNQAIVLCAVAREYGITDQDTQVQLLAATLCDRDGSDPSAPPEEDAESCTPVAVVKKLWGLAGVPRAAGAELAKRPHPQRIFRYLGMLPAVGAVAGYFGEYGALLRAAEAGEAWIASRT